VEAIRDHRCVLSRGLLRERRYSQCLDTHGVFRFQSCLLTSLRRKIPTLTECAVSLSPDSSGQYAVDHDVDGVAKPFVDISCYKLGGVGSDQRKTVGW
jgi:hypothetical protein